MTQELLFKDFDNLLETENSIPKIREFILQLAVQGRLVEQDPKDEPASVLLEKIKEEKERLIKEGKIKKSKALTLIEPDESPYELPEKWEWVRLAEIINISSGQFLPKDNMVNGVIPVYGGNGITGYHNEFNVEKPTIVIGRVGFYCGSVHLTSPKAWVTDNAFITTFSESNIDKGFLFWLLKATDLGQNDSSTAQPVISGRKVYPLIVGLPPIKEQKRIVAKVDKLMALCDELEEKQQKAHDTQLKLNGASLNSLLNAKNFSEFSKYWQLICDNFDLLYSEVENVKELRQAILQLAVQGKLVPQDSKEEASSVLLDKIKKEKELLIKKGKIKNPKPLPPIKSDEVSYKLPKRWMWIRLGEIFNLKTGATPSTKNPIYWNGNIKWLKSGDVNQGEIHDCDGRITEEGLNASNCKILPRDSVLIALNGQGKTRGTVAMLRTESTCNQSLVAMISYDNMLVTPEYLLWYLRANYMNIRNITGHKQRRGLNMGIISKLIVAIPPTNEQKRIVTRVDKLMALCDELEEKIKQSEELSEKLLESVVHNALTTES